MTELQLENLDFQLWGLIVCLQQDWKEALKSAMSWGIYDHRLVTFFDQGVDQPIIVSHSLPVYYPWTACNEDIIIEWEQTERRRSSRDVN